MPMRSLIDMAADRGAFIDQSQSLNLFIESPNIGQLSSMYFYAWKKGLKTTYYLRSRPATRIAKTTVASNGGGASTGAAASGAEARSAVSAGGFKKPVMAAGAASALKAKAMDAANATDDAARHSMPPEANATAPVDPRVTTAQALAAVACSLENPESCEACQ
jgi:ribonucleoside-diphosphate reductase alpha chain